MGQHDVSYRILFSHPHLVEGLIRGFLPAGWVEGLDFTTLEPVSEAHGTEDWSTRYNDRIWRLRWRDDARWLYLYLMLEFQRTAPPFMAVRVLSYEGVLYEHLVKALELGADDLLPWVVPVVIYNGEAAWQPATDVFDLLPPAPAGMEDYLPRLKYVLLDVRRLPLSKLEAMHNATACLFRLEASPSLELTVPALHHLDGLLDRDRHAALRRDVERWVREVLLPSRMPGVNLPDDGRLEEIGPMLAENTLDWTAEWRMKGLAEGRKEGRKEGEAILLLRLLERKFGPVAPTVRRRVRSAGARQLLEWGERLLTAASLPEVFGEPE